MFVLWRDVPSTKDKKRVEQSERQDRIRWSQPSGISKGQSGALKGQCHTGQRSLGVYPTRAQRDMRSRKPQNFNAYIQSDF